MKILISGSTGLIGSALIPFLTAKGHQSIRLTRSAPIAPSDVRWDPIAGTVDTAALEGLDGVVHLAGESIAEGRWTPEKKAKIKRSRVNGTRVLCESLAKLSQPPGAIVCSSAIGFYGDRGDEILTEESPPGKGFLAEVCREWEAAAEAAARRGIRVVNLRTGLVLSARGGALSRMLVPFKLGVGGKVGSGKQYMSWIDLDDLVAAIGHSLIAQSLRGPVNAVTPNPVTNLQFTETLGKLLSRPTVFPMPAFAARVALGEMADELLLASARVKPAKLLAEGFQFGYPELEGALRHVLGQRSK